MTRLPTRAVFMGFTQRVSFLPELHGVWPRPRIHSETPSVSETTRSTQDLPPGSHEPHTPQGHRCGERRHDEEQRLDSQRTEEPGEESAAQTEHSNGVRSRLS